MIANYSPEELKDIKFRKDVKSFFERYSAYDIKEPAKTRNIFVHRFFADIPQKYTFEQILKDMERDQGYLSTLGKELEDEFKNKLNELAQLSDDPLENTEAFNGKYSEREWPYTSFQRPYHFIRHLLFCNKDWNHQLLQNGKLHPALFRTDLNWPTFIEEGKWKEKAELPTCLFLFMFFSLGKNSWSILRNYFPLVPLIGLKSEDFFKLNLDRKNCVNLILDKLELPEHFSNKKVEDFLDSAFSYYVSKIPDSRLTNYKYKVASESEETSIETKFQLLFKSRNGYLHERTLTKDWPICLEYLEFLEAQDRRIPFTSNALNLLSSMMLLSAKDKSKYLNQEVKERIAKLVCETGIEAGTSESIGMGLIWILLRENLIKLSL